MLAHVSQCFHFVPPEIAGKILFSGIFKGYKIGTLARNGLEKR